MVRFFVYRDGPDMTGPRAVIRWGMCPADAVALQANPPHEVAVIGGDSLLTNGTNYYDPETQVFSAQNIAPWPALPPLT